MHGPDSATKPTPQHRALALLLALLTFAVALGNSMLLPYGQPPDELAHAGYVDDVALGGRLVPDYRDSRIGDARGPRNYLMHPPLYYTATGLLARACGWSARRDYSALRAVSALLVAGGMLLWMLTLARFGLSPPRCAALGLSALAIPMFGCLAGAINNDDLGYFAAAVFFHGVALQPQQPRRASGVMAVGMTMALLTKLTVAAFLVYFALAWLLLEWRRGNNLLAPRHARIALCLVLAACLAWYLPTWVEYGTPFPRPQVMYGDRPPPLLPDSPWRFAGRFVWTLLATLPAVVSNLPYFPYPAPALLLFGGMLLAAALAWMVARRAAPASRLRSVVDAFVIAFVLCLASHFLVTYRDYLQHGMYAAMQPRYYNYAVPMLFALGFLLDRGSRTLRVLFAAFAITAAAGTVTLAANSADAHRAAVLAKDRILHATFDAAPAPRR